MLVKGLKVVEVLDEQGKGARAGIKQGDILIKINKIQLERVEDLVGFMASSIDKKPCTLSLMTTQEGFKLIEVEVGTLGLSLVPVELNKIFKKILATTTPSLEGYKIVEYLDVLNSFHIDMGDENPNEVCILKLKEAAYYKGANAIIGVAFNVSSNTSNQQGWLGSEVEGFISTEVTHYASGTAVRVEKNSR